MPKKSEDRSILNALVRNPLIRISNYFITPQFPGGGITTGQARATVLFLTITCGFFLVVGWLRLEIAGVLVTLLIVGYWGTFGRMELQRREESRREDPLDVKFKGEIVDWRELPESEQAKRLVVGGITVSSILVAGVYILIMVLNSLGSSGGV